MVSSWDCIETMNDASLALFAYWFAEFALISSVTSLLSSLLGSAVLRCLELEVCCLDFASLL